MSEQLLFVKTQAELNALSNANPNSPILVHFSANWYEPCKQMDQVVSQLQTALPAIKTVKVEAEEADELSEKFQIECVPTCVLLWKNETKVRIDGANPADLSKKVTDFVRSIPGTTTATSQPTSTNNTTSSTNKKTEPASSVSAEMQVKLKNLTNSSSVMLFMKGSPQQPQCGFSRQIVQLLQSKNITFGHFDILSDEAVRSALKIYSEWPTYPQLYVKGELVGGLDIVREQIEDGSLVAMIPEDALKDKLHAKLKSLINQSPVMVFIKGSPQTPQCGFSRQIVEILNQQKVQFGYFNILSDESVRQGLKEYSEWPTFPQLYIKGELIGGLDIVKELVNESEFVKMVPPEAKAQ
eukprot:c20476_g1_i1.p2 GENE.c20476_g1_i1~~c20476_g1_i1.p2  ORF type:complete len:354 (+),score=158.30 c20476_g1_i1:1979-3040(+)